MKKIVGIIVCLSLMLSILIVPTYAVGDSSDDSIFVYINGPILESGDLSEFVEGAEVVLSYTFIYYENGTYVYETESITSIMEYINIPLSNVVVEAYHKLDNFSYKATNALDQYMNSEFSSASHLRSADITYNCHSYAWYSLDPGNEYWIDFPDLFYQTGIRYYEVTTPQVGDIICYYNAAGLNLHSGIVTAINQQSSNDMCGNSNTVQVTSKWGMYGLYSHNGYQCPYTLHYINHPNYTATSVKYFREHNHSMNYVNVTTYYQHRATCRTCGHSYLESHNWQTTNNIFFSCSDCHVITDGPILLASVPDYLVSTLNATVGIGDGAIAYNDNTLLCRVDGEYYLVKGVSAEQAVTYVVNNTLVTE